MRERATLKKRLGSVNASHETGISVWRPNLYSENHRCKSYDSENGHKTSDDSGHRIRHVCVMFSHHAQVVTMLNCSQHKGDQPDCDQKQRKLPWSKSAVFDGLPVFAHVLKELVDSETKTDQRRRRSHPRHQSPFVRETRPV